MGKDLGGNHTTGRKFDAHVAYDKKEKMAKKIIHVKRPKGMKAKDDFTSNHYIEK